MRLLTRAPAMSEPTPSDPRSPTPPAGARAILSAQIAKLAFRFLSAAILARLLTPDDYGVHGMAMVFYGLLYMARDLGVFATIQQPDLPPQRFNALCQLAFGGGVALALLSVALGPL